MWTGTSVLCNEDASSEKLAAMSGLPQMIIDQTKIEKEASLHLTDL